MRYCLNIQDGSHELNWRLQKDLTWLFSTNNSTISENDFSTEDPQVILDLQVRKENLIFTIDDQKYVCHHDEDFDSNDFTDELAYKVYAFSEKYPKPPTIVQLKQTLLNRDTSVDTFLVLKSDGLFHALTKELWDKGIRYASVDIVCRLKDLPAGKRRILFFERPLFFNRRELDYCFTVALNSWRNFIKNKALSDDIDFYDEVAINDVPEIYSELEQMQANLV